MKICKLLTSFSSNTSERNLIYPWIHSACLCLAAMAIRIMGFWNWKGLHIAFFQSIETQEKKGIKLPSHKPSRNFCHAFLPGELVQEGKARDAGARLVLLQGPVPRNLTTLSIIPQGFYVREAVWGIRHTTVAHAPQGLMLFLELSQDVCILINAILQSSRHHPFEATWQLSLLKCPFLNLHCPHTLAVTLFITVWYSGLNLIFYKTFLKKKKKISSICIDPFLLHMFPFTAWFSLLTACL